MLAPWVAEEMKSAELNDERLNRRLEEVLSALAERPTASIPAACGGHAEMAAAYPAHGVSPRCYTQVDAVFAPGPKVFQARARSYMRCSPSQTVWGQAGPCVWAG
jgi:hypothetical protein